MKKLFLIVLSLFLFISCKKEEIEKEQYEMPNIITEVYTVVEIDKVNEVYWYYTIQATYVAHKYKLLVLDIPNKYELGSEVTINVKNYEPS